MFGGFNYFAYLYYVVLVLVLRNLKPPYYGIC